MSNKFESDIDALFNVPLSEFTAARNALAARLKKEGQSEAAANVKGLAKPSSTAWAVNQLYWKHRKEFDRLLEAGEQFRKAQVSHLAGKSADVRKRQTERREVLSNLSRLAAELLRDAGHSPAPETIHRITTTLEAISSYESHSDAPVPGRLSADVDPPGFDALAALVSGSRPIPKTPKVSLKILENALADARARAQKALTGLKKANTQAKHADARKREAEQRLAKAAAAAEKAATAARNAEIEADQAAEALEAAERALEKASRQLGTL